MKKKHFFLLGAIGLLLASCSQDDLSMPVEQPGDTASLSFNVALPETFTTRAGNFGNGAAASNLYVWIYETTTSGSTPVFVTSSTQENFFSSSNSGSLTLNLVKGKSYDIVFFAASSAAMTNTSSTGDSNAVYQIDEETGTLTVNYANMTSEGNSSDDYDCFYYNYTVENLTASSAANISLVRPVAQVNWGTNDLVTSATSIGNVSDVFGANGEYIVSKLTTKPYTTLDFFTGTVGGQETSDLTFPQFSILENETFPTGTGYTYVAAQYLLVPSTSTLLDLSLAISNAGNTSLAEGNVTVVLVSVTNANVQANYQTNIYGNLLSAQTSITISKDAWEDNQYNIDMKWDGTSTTPSYDPTTQTITINKASDLAGLADIVNGTSTIDGVKPDLSGVTIQLATDYDMGGFEFPTIGSGNRVSGFNMEGNAFNGTFDGQGHTISNVKITGTSNAKDAIGIFPNLGSNAEIKDITFANLEINAPQNEQAGVIGTMNGSTVSNITVSSGSITAKEAAAGIVGRMMQKGKVTGCENHATINSGTNGGGIVGAAYYTSTEGTMTISQCNNYGNITGTSQANGGIVGLSAANLSNCNNYGNVSSSGPATGGIVGQQTYYGTINECENSGNVTGTGYGAGGIVGWIRYNSNNVDNTASYPLQAPITVSNSKNSGIIKGVSGAGGIVGVWYMCGVCKGNTNTSQSITATSQWASGIVGGSQWTETGPVNVSAEDNFLFVTGNTSTTTMDQLFGPSRNLLIYINSPQYVQVSDNTIPE